jgi:hypothetical protein
MIELRLHLFPFDPIPKPEFGQNASFVQQDFLQDGESN